MCNTKTLVAAASVLVLFASGLASAAAYPQTGRVDFSDRQGLTRTAERVYTNGRVSPDDVSGAVFSHEGRKVTQGRTG